MFEFKYYILTALTSFVVFIASYYYFTKMYLKRKCIYILTNPYLIVLYTIFGLLSCMFIIISLLFNLIYFFESSIRESDFKITASNVQYMDRAIESSNNIFDKENLIQTKEQIIERAETNKPYDYMDGEIKKLNDVKTVKPKTYLEIKNKSTKTLENIGG